ncbi:hypothetical protein [Micromonospora sp. NPDC002575]|uniref:hypothetical protein n=1 Tax=Micromonospora sp. NPDC002575 TaxID=3364222 RepID=UPI00368DC8BF
MARRHTFSVDGAAFESFVADELLRSAGPEVDDLVVTLHDKVTGPRRLDHPVQLADLVAEPGPGPQGEVEVGAHPGVLGIVGPAGHRRLMGLDRGVQVGFARQLLEPGQQGDGLVQGVLVRAGQRPGEQQPAERRQRRGAVRLGRRMALEVLVDHVRHPVPPQVHRGEQLQRHGHVDQLAGRLRREHRLRSAGGEVPLHAVT